MNISIILTRILGITFVILGSSMALNKKWTANAIEEIFKNQGVVWVIGFITVCIGATLVSLNNTWTSGLPLWITVLGWLTLLKGAIILIFPGFSFTYYEKMNRGNIFLYGGVVVFAIGAILLMQ
jgi:hypothetical protein